MKLPPEGCQIPVKKRYLYNKNEKDLFHEEYYLEGHDLIAHLNEYKSYEENFFENLKSSRAKEIIFKNLITNVKFLISVIGALLTFIGTVLAFVWKLYLL